MRRLAIVICATGVAALGWGLALTLGSSVASARPGTTTTQASQTVHWSGNGTDNGYCSNENEGLSNVPPGEQGWLFILTQPASGPWELTAMFQSSGTEHASGTQEGNGSVHFVVYTSANDQLVSASATHGTEHSVLTVSGCTQNHESTTTTTSQATTTTTTSQATTTTSGNTTTTTRPTEMTTTTAAGASTTTAPGSTGSAGGSVSGATNAATGEAFAGSGPYELMAVGAGLMLVGGGLLLRRRQRIF